MPNSLADSPHKSLWLDLQSVIGAIEGMVVLATEAGERPNPEHLAIAEQALVRIRNEAATGQIKPQGIVTETWLVETLALIEQAVKAGRIMVERDRQGLPGLPPVVDRWPTMKDELERRCSALRQVVSIPKPDGPLDGKRFRFGGQEYELEVQPKQMELLRFTWGKAPQPIRKVAKHLLDANAVAACRSARDVYNKIKFHVCRLNSEFVKLGLPLSIQKSEDFLTYDGLQKVCGE
jgi:hypothetical protein